MEMIDSINVEKFNDAMVVIGKGPCVKFDCDRQSICAEEKVECKAFRYWVNNDSYWTKRKGKKTSIKVDMQRLLTVSYTHLTLPTILLV